MRCLTRFCDHFFLQQPLLFRVLSFFLFVIPIFFMRACAGNSFASDAGDQMIKDIPYHLIKEDRREEIRGIVDSHTLLRFLKEVEYEIDKPVLVFLVERPVLLAAVLKAMNIRDYIISDKNNGTYAFDDRNGISGYFERVHSGFGQKYYYAFGGYKVLFFDLKGRAAIFFRYQTSAESGKKSVIRADVYSKVDNVVVEFFLKVLRPIIRPMMDRKIKKFIQETQELSHDIVSRPEKVYQAVQDSGYPHKEEMEAFKKLILANSLEGRK